jgi:hypothetical protein
MTFPLPKGDTSGQTAISLGELPFFCALDFLVMGERDCCLAIGGIVLSMIDGVILIALRAVMMLAIKASVDKQGSQVECVVIWLKRLRQRQAARITVPTRAGTLITP